MSIEQMIIKMEQCFDVLDLYTSINEEPALNLVQETLHIVIQNLNPYVKVVDVR